MTKRGTLICLVVAAPLAAGGCIPADTLEESLAACIGSADIEDLKAQFLFAAVIKDFVRNTAKPGKSAKVKPAYDVHFLEINGPARTCDFFLKDTFGVSTPLRVPFEALKGGKQFGVDAAIALPNATQFLEERIEEVLTEQVVITSATLTGTGKPNAKSKTLKGSFTLEFSGTLASGSAQGTVFTGSMKIKGTAAGFVAD